MGAADTLLGGERDVIARFQRFLRRLYAYRELLAFGECFIGHIKTHMVFTMCIGHLQDVARQILIH